MQIMHDYHTLKYRKGFTLIEVMVALVIIGLALPALIFRFSIMLDQTGRIEEKNYAMWLAQNKYHEFTLNARLSKQLDKGKQTDTETFAGLTYVWTLETFDSEVPEVMRIEIKTGREEDAWLARLDGFVSAE